MSLVADNVLEIAASLHRLTARQMQRWWLKVGLWLLLAAAVAVLLNTLRNSILHSIPPGAPALPWTFNSRTLLACAGLVYSPIAVAICSLAWFMAGRALYELVMAHDELRAAVSPQTLRQGLMLLMLRQGVAPIILVVLISAGFTQWLTANEQVGIVVVVTLWALFLMLCDVPLGYCLAWLGSLCWLTWLLLCGRMLLSISTEMAGLFTMSVGSFVNASWATSGLAALLLSGTLVYSITRGNWPLARTVLIAVILCGAVAAWRDSLLPSDLGGAANNLPGDMDYDSRLIGGYLGDVGSAMRDPLVRVRYASSYGVEVNGVIPHDWNSKWPAGSLVLVWLLNVAYAACILALQLWLLGRSLTWKEVQQERLAAIEPTPTSV